MTVCVLLAVAGGLAIIQYTRNGLRHDLALSAVLIVLPLLIPIVTSPLRIHWLHVQDRLEYLSTTGVCLLAGVLLDRLSVWLPVPRRTLLLACCFLVPMGALATLIRYGLKW